MTDDRVPTLAEIEQRVEAARRDGEYAYGEEAQAHVACLLNRVKDTEAHNAALYQQWLDVQDAENTWERYGIGCHRKWLAAQSQVDALREALRELDAAWKAISVARLNGDGNTLVAAHRRRALALAQETQEETTP